MAIKERKKINNPRISQNLSFINNNYQLIIETTSKLKSIVIGIGKIDRIFRVNRQ